MGMVAAALLTKGKATYTPREECRNVLLLTKGPALAALDKH